MDMFKLPSVDYSEGYSNKPRPRLQTKLLSGSTSTAIKTKQEKIAGLLDMFNIH